MEHSSERMKGNDYNFNLCEACIILKRTNFSDTAKQADCVPCSTFKPAKRLKVEEGGAAERGKTSTEAERLKAAAPQAELVTPQVKLKRAQGECLGIRSRRRT